MEICQSLLNSTLGNPTEDGSLFSDYIARMYLDSVIEHAVTKPEFNYLNYSVQVLGKR